MFSGRIGSGLLIARLPDGTWSSPSCIGLAGAGVGGQIGLELTDFVMILNTKDAVKTFAALGSVTLGGNISIAAGPVGRSAEASGSASHRGVSAIFSYSKTKGLFAGVSLEGSVLIERRDANKKFYRRECTAKHILNGSIPPPPGVEPLHRVLESRIFKGRGGGNGDDMYNDIPVYGDADSDVWQGRDGDAFGEGVSRSSTMGTTRSGQSGSKTRGYEDDYDDAYDNMNDRFGSQSLDSRKAGGSARPLKSQSTGFRSTYTDSPPGRPTSEKPKFGDTGSPASRKKKETYASPYEETHEDNDDDYHHHNLDENGFARQSPAKAPPRPSSNSKPSGTRAVALYTFDADQPGDLGFEKGDTINILEKSESVDDWWTGELGGRSGIFPVSSPWTVSARMSLLILTGQLRAIKIGQRCAGGTIHARGTW